jgi:cytochrome-b5 reductase
MLSSVWRVAVRSRGISKARSSVTAATQIFNNKIEPCKYYNTSARTNTRGVEGSLFSCNKIAQKKIELFKPFITQHASKYFSSTEAKTLSPTEYKPVKLVEKTQVNYNTQIYTFELPANEYLNMPLGKHLTIRAKIDGHNVSRPFTPITPHNVPGRIDLLIKLYQQGKMSQHLEKMKIGQTIDVMGPIGMFNIDASKYKEIGMVAGGSGITPMLQVVRNLLADNHNKAKLTLLFANNTEEDIVLKDLLDDLAEKHKERFSVRYVLVKPPTSGHNYESGFVSDTIIKKCLPAPSSEALLLICGPAVMEKSIMSHLSNLGYPREMYFTFTYAQRSSDEELPPSANNTQTEKEYTLSEVEDHDTEDDCWMAIYDNVYDVTKFINEHPGGMIIADYAGRDATEAFENEFPHSDEAKKMLAKYKIGKLKK